MLEDIPMAQALSLAPKPTYEPNPYPYLNADVLLPSSVLQTLVLTPVCDVPVLAAPGSTQATCSLCEGVQNPQQDFLLLLLWHTHFTQLMF